MTTPAFQWLPEYDALLDSIASTDVVNSDWTILKNVIKYKVEKNISLFLSDKTLPTPPPTFQALTLPSGGLKLPPFPPRRLSHIHMSDSYITENQAKDMRDVIFTQLDEFDSKPPFTIQRVCELCLHPKQHYASVGKYLRAVEKSLLVTSTWDSFPSLTGIETDPTGRNILTIGPARQSVPTTPLFSPIPFLHDDARRSKSRSPPPSPLALSSAISAGLSETSGPKALGLVDELDDPSPGHMSEHPTALSAVTTISDGSGSRPFLGSLEQRFVKSEEGSTKQSGSDSMVVDDDKENSKS